MKIEKRLKLYVLDAEIWLPEGADILDLAIENKLLQLVVWENTAKEVLLKRRFVYVVTNDVFLDARGMFFIGAIFDPELEERVYVFELK